MKKCHREVAIGVIIERGVFKNKQIIFLCFTFIPKTGMRLPKTGISFYWDEIYREG